MSIEISISNAILIQLLGGLFIDLIIYDMYSIQISKLYSYY